MSGAAPPPRRGAVAMATRPAAAAQALKGGLVPGGALPAGGEGPRPGRPAARKCRSAAASCPLVSCRPGFPELLLENEEKPQQEDVFRRQKMCVCVFLCMCVSVCVCVFLGVTERK